MSVAHVVDAGDRRSQRLAVRLAEVVGVINRAHAELVDLAASALATEAWAEPGVTSAAHWLVLRAGLSPSRARQVLMLARRSAELPETVTLFSGGDLSFEQAFAVAQHTPAAYDSSVAELAPFMTVPQIRRAVGRYVFDEDAADDAAEPADAAVPTDSAEPTGTDAFGLAPIPSVDDPSLAPPSLRIGWSDRQRFQLSFDGPAPDGALIEAALRDIRTREFAESGVSPTLGEAFVLMVQRALDGQPVGDPRITGQAAGQPARQSARQDRVRAYIHLDTEGGWCQGKGRLPLHVIRPYTCDGVLQPVWHTEGVPVSVGRAQRIVPARTRRLIEDRDRGCRFPGCPSRGHVDVHHIVHWQDGGGTDTDNLVCLCSRHHDGHHRGDFAIAGDPNLPDETSGALVFTSRYDWRITAGPPTPRSGVPHPDSGVPDPDSARPYVGPTGEELHIKWIEFTRRV